MSRILNNNNALTRICYYFAAYRMEMKYFYIGQMCGKDVTMQLQQRVHALAYKVIDCTLKTYTADIVVYCGQVIDKTVTLGNANKSNRNVRDEEKERIEARVRAQVRRYNCYLIILCDKSTIKIRSSECTLAHTWSP